MPDPNLASLLSRAQQCLGFAASCAYDFPEQLSNAIELHKRMGELSRTVRVETPLAPGTAELAKMTPKQLTDRVRQSALDHLAADRSEAIVEEWRDAAIRWLHGAVERSIADWTRALCADFDTAMTALRGHLDAYPNLDRVQVETLDADALLTWREARLAVTDVDRLLNIRVSFGEFLGEQPSTQRFGRLTPYVASIAPLPSADPSQFESDWRPRLELLESAATAEPVSRWTQWLQAERNGWITISLAYNDLTARVDAAQTFGNLGNAWVTSDGGRSLAAAMGQLANWHQVSGAAA